MKTTFLKTLVAAVVALPIALSGCITDIDVNGPTDGPTGGDGKLRLELFTRTPDYIAPTAATRAGSAQEGALGETPWVLVFEGTDDDAIYVEAARAFSMASKIFVELTPQTDPCRLLVLANPQAGFTLADGTAKAFDSDVFDDILDGLTLADASELLHTQPLADPQPTVPFASATTADQLPLPLSGVFPAVGGTTIGPNTTVSLALDRAVAKVVVTNSAANLTLTGATVIDTPIRGTLHRQDTTLKTNDADDRTDYTEIVSADADGANQTTAANPIYVYESSKADASHTHVIIRGAYDGAVNYYKLSFRDPAAPVSNPNAALDIMRNKIYEFTIAEVKRAGYSTLADAMAAERSSNEDIVWEITVTDAYSHDIIDNGEYYLGVTNSHFIAYGIGALPDRHAFTITTDRTDPLADNSIKVSAGLSLTAPSDGKIVLGGNTEVKLLMLSAFTSGTVTLRLGDITKVITVEKRPPIEGTQPFVAFEGDYMTATIEAGDWLTGLSTDGIAPRSNSVNDTGGNIYIHPALNYGPTGTEKRGGVVYLSRLDPTAGRIKVELSQNVTPIVAPPRVPTLPYPYVGTFHRASETGERNVRVPSAAGGAWRAEVVVGEDFIVLGDERPGFPWNDGDSEAYQVEGTLTEVRGVATTGGEIRFRVGMRSQLSATNPDNTTPPRYGKIVVAYDDYTKCHEIYVRQGEAADYLLRQSDGSTNGVLSSRPLARRFSPYNLTAAEFNGAGVASDAIQTSAGGNSWVDVRPGGAPTTAVFTDYPSQAGAFFMWADSKGVRAYNPTGDPVAAGDWDWTEGRVGGFWNTLAATYESCPTIGGVTYRRPTDGPTDSAVSSISIHDSEMFQSLSYAPAESSGLVLGENPHTSVFGYYADGFFDRRTIENATGMRGVESSAVSVGNSAVAYTGRLYYNEATNSSLFFPASGNRGYSGLLNDVGSFGSYWTSGSSSAVGIPRGYSVNLAYHAARANSYRYGGAFIRCIVGETLLPPPPPTVITPPASPLPNTYVGAFWRADQTGERIISIPVDAANTGLWSVQVYSHGIPRTAANFTTADGVTTEFKTGDILLSNAFSADPRLPGADPAGWTTPAAASGAYPEETYKVTAAQAKTSIVGSIASGGRIYFRIGLKTEWEDQSEYDPDTNPARYAVLLLSYGGRIDGTGFKHQLIYLRQGHEADFLMRQADGSGNGVVSSRPLAKRFSPYNLTAAEFNGAGVASDPVQTTDGGNSWVDVGARGGVFTDYPSQAGAFFKWAHTEGVRAYNPVGDPASPSDWNWGTSNVVTGFWNTLSATYESCPTIDGMTYRRPTDGPTDVGVDLVSINDSEMHQSLSYNPEANGGATTSNIDNTVWGYYADGFFDRQTLATSGTGTGNSAVAFDNSSVAYIGHLFYNPTGYNSLFLPASGNRSNTEGVVSNSGSNGYYWSSSSRTGSMSWRLIFGDQTPRRGNSSRPFGISVRCVKD